MASNNSINNSCLGGFTASGGTINISNDAASATVNVGTGGAVKTTTLGSNNSTSATTVQSGSGALNVTSANGAITVTSGTGTIAVANDATNNTCTFGNGAGVKLVTIGSTSSTSASTLQSGTGGINVTATNGSLTINSGTGTLGIATDATANTVNIGTGGGIKTCTFGSNSSSSATTLRSGSGALNITSTNGSMTITSGTGTLAIANDATAQTVNIGIGGGVKICTLGSTNSTSSTAIQSGTGGLPITSNNGVLTINSGTGTMNIATDATNNTINIGTGGAVKTVTLGSTNTSSTTTITGGTGGIQMTNTFVNLPTTTSTTGQIRINNSRFLHSYGSANSAYIGNGAGNFTLTGADNYALGAGAMAAFTSGDSSIAIGTQALGSGTTTGSKNIAMGYQSGVNNNGSFNVSIGPSSLNGVTAANHNVSIGYTSGSSLTTSDSSNLLINNAGVSGDNNTMRLGAGAGTGDRQLNKAFIYGIRGITTGNADAIAVLVDSAGQLGTVSSSIRFKENIKDMGDISGAILDLRPVTFDFIGKPSHKKQVGLIAEEVEKVMPSLVVHNQDGEVESVKYHELPVLLLNELQKAVKRIELLEYKLGLSTQFIDKE